MQEILGPLSGQLPPPKLIAAARLIAGLTQRELAVEAGVGTSSLARYEAGMGSMRVDTLSAVVAALRNHGIRFLDPTPEILIGLALVRPAGRAK